MKILNGFLFLGLLLSIISCGGSNNEQDKDGKKLDRRTEIRLMQYKVEGKKLYQLHCANCHQENGEGLARLYPRLAGSDYLLNDLPRAACIIKYGQSDTITVNGVEFNQVMPGVPTLTPIEVAEILTYVSNSWGNEAGISSTRDVSKWLDDCKR